MISPEQVEEWINEVEGRPSSAALIIRYIAARLRDLTDRNEELLSENIELRTGRKVEEYESRIANLEYQLDLLKRQLGGEVNGKAFSQPAVESINFLSYTTKGQVLRIECSIASLSSGKALAAFSETPPGAGPLRILATIPTEELLFVFDSGRTEALPVTNIPTSSLAADGTGKIGWENAFLIEPHGNEELVTVLPVARMTLYDCCVQVSRRGCAKKMMKTSFESHVAKSFVGAGVKGKPDKTCSLVLSGKDDLLVLVSRDGFLWTLDINQLPYTIEEVCKLGPIDYLITSFAIKPDRDPGAGQKRDASSSIFILTQNGKVIHREASWLEKPASYKSHGQASFSQARREAGVRVVGAAAITDEDWGAALSTAGELTVHKISDLLETGSLSSNPTIEIVDFVAFQGPGAKKA